MRQNTAAVQTNDLDGIVVVRHELADFTCPITLQIIFDPVMTHCGQHIERTASATRLSKCPCCNNASHNQFTEVSAFYKTTLQKVIQENNLYQDVFFNLEDFKRVVAENKLTTPLGERFLTLLQNATSHLNTKELTRTETQITHPAYLEIPQVTVVETQGKSPIEILAETRLGRDLLRKKLKIVSTSSETEAASGSEKYFFGNAEILAESLQTQINGKSIQEWLSMTTAMEVMYEEEQKARQAMHDDAKTTFCQLRTQFPQALLFLARSARSARRAATASRRIPSAAVNQLLQQVVHGEENKVKDALEANKSNTAQLSELLLSDTDTVKDYSDRIITGMTLLQAAAAAGDIDMCLMLKNYMSREEFAAQLSEIFLEEIEQQRNTFNFEAILEAILTAILTATPENLDDALNKIGAEFTQSDSARTKPDRELSLIEALNRFREQFAQHSHNEKIFNPQHLLRVFEVYDALWDQCDRRADIDRDYKKRDLFWRQIIGFCQRFMPACYAQAYSQGLYYLVKVKQDTSWRPETFKRDLKLRDDASSYFPLPRDSRSGLGFDFAIFSCWAGPNSGRRRLRSQVACMFLETFVEKKHQAFRALCRECGAHHTASLMAGGA